MNKLSAPERIFLLLLHIFSQNAPKKTKKDPKKFPFSDHFHRFVFRTFSYGSSDMTSAATKYANIPVPHPNTKITAISRTTVGSILKYSAIPPHTPKILRSVRDLYKRFTIIPPYVSSCDIYSIHPKCGNVNHRPRFFFFPPLVSFCLVAPKP